jgi:ribosomal-protein-alanine N-acetyltransferase
VAAVALYHALQFDEMGVRRDYYPAKNGREDAILMEWKC